MMTGAGEERKAKKSNIEHFSLNPIGGKGEERFPSFGGIIAPYRCFRPLRWNVFPNLGEENTFFGGLHRLGGKFPP
jgi:hypothetical protein